MLKLMFPGKVEQFYKARRDNMLRAADRHLDGLCEYSVPLGGMFLWMRVPGLSSTWDMIMERGLQNNIMLMPGKVGLSKYKRWYTIHKVPLHFCTS